jgi:hypothetical protein
MFIVFSVGQNRLESEFARSGGFKTLFANIAILLIKKNEFGAITRDHVQMKTMTTTSITMRTKIAKTRLAISEHNPETLSNLKAQRLNSYFNLIWFLLGVDLRKYNSNVVRS